MVITRAIYTAGVAAICLVVLATRVAVEFPRIRIRVITAPTSAPQDPTIAVPLPDLSELTGSPAAIVIRLRGALEPTRITVTFDSRPVADVLLPASDEIRVDAASSVSPGNHQIVVRGDRTGWALNALEIANIHGFSRGWFGFVIVPRTRTQFDAVPIPALVLAFLALLALRPRLDWPANQRLRWICHGGAGIVLLLFGVVLFADRFTPFKLLLSPRAFLISLAILYPEHTALVTRRLIRIGVGLLRWLERLRREYSPAVIAGWRRVVAGVETAAAIPWLPGMLALAMAVMVAGLAVAVGTHGAGGADSYGYVSQSELWAKGQLYIDQPFAAEIPDYGGDELITPLGWVGQQSARVPGRIVPSYSPGLPMMMAPLRLALGPDGIYLVVPVLAGLTVWLTFLLGRQLDGDATGLFAALWLASSPGVVGSAFSPMSDVPVTAWWLAGLVAAFRSGAGSAALAGLATSLAVLARPNLAPLTAVVALPYLYRFATDRSTWRTCLRNLIIFLVTAAIGPAIVAALFNYWYGSPFKSGYGNTSDLFSWEYLQTNLENYPRWLVESQTVLIFAGLITPFLLRGRTKQQGLPTAAIAWILVTMCALVWASYLTYFPFDDWGYLRFLLPSYPPLIALSSAAFVFVLRRTFAPRLLGTALVALIMIAGLDFGGRAAIFTMYLGETRYQRVAEFIAMSLPERALLMSMQHSGSLRYYSGRITVRYDLLRSTRLDQLVADFAARDYPVYFVLDDWEEKEFRRRFAEFNTLGKLDWKPIARLRGGNPVVIYDPRSRGASTPVRTRIIP